MVLTLDGAADVAGAWFIQTVQPLLIPYVRVSIQNSDEALTRLALSHLQETGRLHRILPVVDWLSVTVRH